MCWVGGVFDGTGGRLPASNCADVCGGGQAAPHNPFCGLRRPLQSRPLCSRAAVPPHRDAGSEDALHHTAMESSQDSPEPPELTVRHRSTYGPS